MFETKFSWYCGSIMILFYFWKIDFSIFFLLLIDSMFDIQFMFEKRISTDIDCCSKGSFIDDKRMRMLLLSIADYYPSIHPSTSHSFVYSLSIGFATWIETFSDNERKIKKKRAMDWIL